MPDKEKILYIDRDECLTAIQRGGYPLSVLTNTALSVAFAKLSVAVLVI